MLSFLSYTGAGVTRKSPASWSLGIRFSSGRPNRSYVCVVVAPSASSSSVTLPRTSYVVRVRLPSASTMVRG